MCVLCVVRVCVRGFNIPTDGWVQEGVESCIFFSSWFDWFSANILLTSDREMY